MGTELSKHLFLFTLGPVQSFIRQARKTRDLYAGSYILSYLCRGAIESLQLRCGAKAEIIFPSLEIESLPNRFLAVLTGYEEEELKSIGSGVENDVRHRLLTMSEKVLTELQLREPKGFREQMESLLQVYWVITEQGHDFAADYKRAESSLGSLKNLRVFSPLTEQPGRKCSVTGEHNVLFYRGNAGSKRLLAGAVEADPRFPQKYLGDGEGLGAVAFVKRCADKCMSGNFNPDFPSTGMIALMNAAKGANISYEELKDWEAQHFFQLKNKMPPSPELSGADRGRVEKLYKRMEKKEISSYYAAVIFDADDMGKWLGGKLLPAGTELKDFHTRLSAKMGGYAQTAKDIVKWPQGVTVYAGGDDFFGFVNLFYLFKVLKALRQEFDRLDLGTNSGGMTFSAGVAIGHHKTPLTEVLGWAHKMEREAKGVDGKDAVGIALLRRAGETTKAVQKWKCTDKLWTTDVLVGLLERLGNKTFSDTFIRVLGREFFHLMDEDGMLQNDGFVFAEMKRLLTRACWLEIKPGETKEDFRNRKKWLVEEQAELLKELYFNSGSLSNFLSTLNIVTFMDREVNQGDHSTKGAGSSFFPGW
ncbi:type III-B CRISPR-associated protein Cas10/Cmr2 [Dethiobacter alkaliphilus]|uniref:type III-B CRISPR-associated protein Cas10/Cmr2 n=1 Tax=Dethiobacter alkaliphilus TaxID=427926 RepID=UPI0022265104|nr:type III-B CRISPR-associated protein Cas10/Cmr2 [Dethiobacter alkaliphilus]MCW3488687.1 type III-B CRISPR-associated protein Cas10/Cmr2 [Dethiobacter alkaliphilus]